MTSVMRRLLAAMAACALAGAAGCASFAPASIVVDLRVLGIEADLPEVVVAFDPQHPEATTFPTVHLTALVADPADTRRLAWEMTACAPTLDERCDDPTAQNQAFASGVIDDPEGATLSEIHAALDIQPGVLQEAVTLDSLAGFGGVAVQIEMCVRPEGEGCDSKHAVWAAKRIVYASKDMPPGRTPNQNPSIDAIWTQLVVFESGRCWDPATTPLDVTAGADVELRPIEPDGIRETYQLPKLSGGVQTITENITYSWFATAGSFSREQSGGPIDLFGNVPERSTVWTAPAADQLADIPGGADDGRVNLWVVQRDERGGQSWVQRCFHVVP